MKDTPRHIEDIQLKIWLSKSPMERLRQMMVDNEALLEFWSVTHKIEPKSTDVNLSVSPEGLQPAS